MDTDGQTRDEGKVEEVSSKTWWSERVKSREKKKKEKGVGRQIRPILFLRGGRW